MIENGEDPSEVRRTHDEQGSKARAHLERCSTGQGLVTHNATTEDITFVFCFLGVEIPRKDPQTW